MSRRTKLIILGIFVVLLGIPIVWGAATWTPSHALSFRVVPLRGPVQRTLQVNKDLVPLGVRVENSSSTAIFINYADLMYISQPEGWATGSLGGIRAGDLPDTTDGIRIPAKSAIETVAFVAEDEVAIANAGQMRVRYTCVTDAKHKVTTLCLWLSNTLNSIDVLSFAGEVPFPSVDRFEANLDPLQD